MAKRYRYAFAKKREAQQGKLSAVLAAVSLVLFVTAVLLAFFLQGQYGYIVGGISLCAMLLPFSRPVSERFFLSPVHTVP